jgi:hypothetical protein
MASIGHCAKPSDCDALKLWRDLIADERGWNRCYEAECRAGCQTPQPKQKWMRRKWKGDEEYCITA